MKTERLVELDNQVGREAADHLAETFHGDRANLLGLGFGIHPDPCLRSW